MDTVKDGDVVSILYVGRYEDGTAFEASGQDPFQFTVGSDDVISGLNQAVLGMHEGEEKTVTILPGDAYGDRRPELQREVERAMLPPEVSVGDQLVAEVGDQEIPVWVVKLDDKAGLIDANHPLAGLTLVFEITMKKIEAGSAA